MKRVDRLAWTQDKVARRKAGQWKERGHFSVRKGGRAVNRLFVHELADFLSQPPIDDYESQKHEWRPLTPPGDLGQLVAKLPAAELARAVILPLLDRIICGWRGGKKKFGDDRARAELCSDVGANVYRLLLYHHIVETGTQRALLPLLTKPQKRKRYRKDEPRAHRGRPRKKLDFKFDDWDGPDFIAVGDWLVDCATTLDFFDIGADGRPCIAPEWQATAKAVYNEALKGSPILPSREPPPPWTGWRNSRGIEFCTNRQTSTRRLIGSAFKETLVVVDDTEPVVAPNAPLREHTIPGNFVRNHVAGMAALQRVHMSSTL